LHGGGQRGNERFIDTGIVIEYEGVLAICEGCVTHLAKLLGLLTPADVQALTDELREANDARVEQAQEIATLKSRNEALRTLLALDVDAFEAPPEPEPDDPIAKGLAVLEEIKAERHHEDNSEAAISRERERA